MNLPTSWYSCDLTNTIFVESGDAEMRLCRVLIFLLLSSAFFAGCGEDSESPEDPIVQIEHGDIYGIVIDAESGIPVEGASVNIGGQVVLTDADGKYVVQRIQFSDEIEVSVISDDYREYKTTISLDQVIMSFDANLTPVDSPTDQILKVLDSFNQDLEALDSDRIPSIHSYFSEDYVAANDPVDDQATLFGIIAGVVPPDYESVPAIMLALVNTCDKLEFRFTDPDVELDEDTASVLMRFEVHAETKPAPPDPGNKWDIVVDARIDLRLEDGNWKMTYWRLIPPFLKFEEKPLE